ncbi:MAG: hypothetical protein M1840_004326 [Geoglossum simile]|nr:MAG: hypothetical protein M1840_004326 [Geoglossum simile]
MSPKSPKREIKRFTTEDDQRLVDLKENKSMSWKQIAEFFPGRSAGSLQVRYCTKLRAKTTQWTKEADLRLSNAIRDYERDRWRVISAAVGTGFSPAACRERAKDL